MENMIKRIVEMDQKARQITEAAQREKLDSEKEIAEKAAQLRADYLERARRRIQLNSDTERAAAEKAWNIPARPSGWKASTASTGTNGWTPLSATSSTPDRRSHTIPRMKGR